MLLLLTNCSISEWNECTFIVLQVLKMATCLPTLSGHVVTRLEGNLKMQYIFIQIVFSYNLVSIRTLRAGQKDPLKLLLSYLVVCDISF